MAATHKKLMHEISREGWSVSEFGDPNTLLPKTAKNGLGSTALLSGARQISGFRMLNSSPRRVDFGFFLLNLLHNGQQ